MATKLTWTGERKNPNDCLNEIAFGGGATGGDFSIPEYDYQAFTYYGSTNNIETRTFYSGGSGGTLVATLTYAYAGGGAADDDLVTSVTQS